MTFFCITSVCATFLRTEYYYTVFVIFVNKKGTNYEFMAKSQFVLNSNVYFSKNEKSASHFSPLKKKKKKKKVQPELWP